MKGMSKLREMKQYPLEKDRLIAAQQERIEELAQALDDFRAEIAETNRP